MTDVKIDDDVPLTRKRSASRRYPIEDLEVGQSFFTAGESETPTPKELNDMQSNLCTCARVVKKRFPDRVFVTRRVEEDSIVGIRMWRTA